MTTATFNGWANWETWNVALWIQNDETTYKVALLFALAMGIGALLAIKAPGGINRDYIWWDD